MKAIHIVICLFFLSSCEKSKEQANGELSSVKNSKFKLQYLRKIDFELDDKTLNWSINSQYVFNAKTKEESVYILDSKTFTINIFNLEGQNIEKIKLEKNGPNGIGYCRGFFCKSKDSLYIISANLKVYLVSSQGRVYQTFNLMNYSKTPYPPYAWSENGADIFYSNETLYVPANPGVSFRKKRKDFFLKGLLNITLNLTDGNVKYQIPYPNREFLESKSFTGTVVTAKCVANEDTKELVYSFPGDSYVYRYGLLGNLKGKHLLKSEYIQGEVSEIPSSQIIGDPLSEAVYYLNNFFYGNLYYDSFRKRYYRLVKHKLNPEAIRKDLVNGRIIKDRYSMIIADQNLNPLGEVDLDNDGKEGFEGNGLFIITKEGILVQSIKKIDEGTIFFNLYDVVQN